MIAALLVSLALSTSPSMGKTIDGPAAPMLESASFAPQAPEPEAVLAGVAVTVECTAHIDGHVGECSVLGETHPGLGFGETAIALMQGSDVAPGPSDVRFARTIQFTP